MLFSKKTAWQKRADFRSALKSNKLLRFPGAFSPLVSMLIDQIGFDGVYISGAALSNDLGLPDIGLTTLGEVSMRGRAIARVTDCLLYTSPSPRDRTRSRMPSSA